ncbi:polysaccharide ABC transporter ATP-binding protein [Pedobacter miscanthi]|uniref:ABC transporter ATP-binding protein n=1 Tax=Pedobacter miscanthi TaxID=2259170 RepID=A0A366L961_9SPHI|nr:polysaccharide ABC transporter ATP-binding protein [Pedobacter miscanthi]RBQ10009.1 ABC transporter ATP-binding protein [Pedobacter miscanthi]
MSDIAIKVENLSKAYQLGQIGTGTISRDLERWYANLRGKEDPFLRIGESNDRSTKGTSNVIWSLKDINFEIEQGDAVGIIGRNGAGKSTLLKILSKVTGPTNGKISGKGRIASLLEVGTGFHPELSGKENIFLNGAILGMRKKEIQRKLEEIVDFAGMERYLDTPVKRYSSGMYVRLAFAVAAHLESEILIVDEVLAVGDAEFQKKCLGKMNQVSKGEGRTVLFVSHNMGSISQLCQSTLILNNGTLEYKGSTRKAIEKYLESIATVSSFNREKQTDGTHITKIILADDFNNQKNTFVFDENINIITQVDYGVQIQELFFSIIVRDTNENALFTSHYNLESQNTTLKLTIPKNNLLPGKYFIEPVMHVPNVEFVDRIDFFLSFYIEDTGGEHSKYNNSNLGFINSPGIWL